MRFRSSFTRRHTVRIHPNTDLLTAVTDHRRIAEERARAAGVAVRAWPNTEWVAWPRSLDGAWAAWRRWSWAADDPGVVGYRDIELGPRGGTIAGAGGSMHDALASVRNLPVTHPDDPR